MKTNVSSVILVVLIGCVLKQSDHVVAANPISDGTKPPTKIREFKTQDIFGTPSIIFGENYRYYHKGDNPDGEWPLTILHVWGPWCRPCIREFPSLIEFAKDNPDLALVAISVNSTKEVLYNFLRWLTVYHQCTTDNIYMRIGSEDSIYFDENYLQIDSFPTTLFIDKNGNIVKRAGSINWAHPYMTTAMKAFREGKPFANLPEISE